MINRILHSWSFHMKFMKLAEDLYEMTTGVRSSMCHLQLEEVRHRYKVYNSAGGLQHELSSSFKVITLFCDNMHFSQT